MIVVGGFRRGCPPAFWRGAETWTFDLATGDWSQLFPMDPPFEGGDVGPAVFDAGRDRILLLGASPVFARPAAGGGTWTALNSAGVTPSRQEATFDPSRDRVLVAQTAGTNTPAADQLWALEFEGTTSVRHDRHLAPSPVGPPPEDARHFLEPAVVRARRIASGTKRSVVVTFSLPDSRPALLRLYDLAGRCLASREVGALGAGGHTVELIADGDLRAGVVFVQLAGQGGQRSAKFAVIH
jgi:hypothetical protein